MINRILKVVFGVLTLISFYYIYRLFVKLDIDWGFLSDKQVLLAVIASVMIVIISLFISSYVYRKNLELLSGKTYPAGVINSVFIKANIGKYIPGNVFHFAGRNMLGQKFNIDQKALLGSTVLLHIQTITLSLLLPLIIDIQIYKGVVVLLKGLLGQKYFLVMGGIIIFTIVLLVIFRKYIIQQSKRFLDSIKNIDIKKVFPNFLVMGIYLILYGISFYIVASSISHIEWSFSGAATIVLSFVIAWLCGLVVIGAPGGMGIREVVLLFLLGNVFVETDLMAIIVVHRFCTTIADIIGFIIMIIRDKFHGENRWEIAS